MNFLELNVTQISDVLLLYHLPLSSSKSSGNVFSDLVLLFYWALET